MQMRENRIVFDLAAIKAVRLRCRECSGEFVQPLLNNAIPEFCPSPKCTARWESKVHSTNKAALDALSNLLHDPPRHVELLFELDGIEAESGEIGGKNA